MDPVAPTNTEVEKSAFPVPAPDPASPSAENKQAGPVSSSRRTRERPAAATIRSLSDSIHDIAGTILYEAGFGKDSMERQEVVEILRFLEDCREEGRSLYPEILLTSDLRKCLEGIHPLRMFFSGECSDRPGRMRRALKKCAAISSEPWIVVLEVSKERVRYGFASSNVRADSTALYDLVVEARSESPDSPPFLFIRRFGTRAVWIKSLKSEQVISLTLSEELLRASEHINSFSKVIVESLPEGTREKAGRVVSRLVQEACREGHGFIACAVRSESDAIEAFKETFHDGSWLSPVLDLSPPTVSEMDTAAVLETDSTLRAAASLARRMLEMDLMTMFSTRAELVGYNIHIESPAGSTVTGGARTRAFRALMENPVVRAGFMCSQDGQTHFQEKL